MSTQPHAELIRQIERARYWLLTNVASYGALACRLTDVIDERIPTACTDGKQIRWNPEWLASKSKEEIRFILAHETLHCAHGHLWRFPLEPLEPAERMLVNVACDFAINGLLHGRDGMTMPPAGCYDPKWNGKAEEEILAELRKEMQQQPQGSGKGKQGQGSGSGDAQDDPCGGFSAPADSDSQGGSGPPQGPPGAQDGQGQEPAPAKEKQSLRDQWENAVLSQAMPGMPGDASAGLERCLARLRAANVDWKAELSGWMKTAMTRTRADWSRCSRRMAGGNVIYPRRKPDAMGAVVLVRDTSGSMDDWLPVMTQTAQDVAAETGGILIVIDCDAAICGEYRIEPGDLVPEKGKGGGGTDFAEPFARAAEIAAEEPLAGLIYLTDLCGGGWPATEEIPTLCVCITSNVAPSGRTIHVTP